MSGLPKNFDTKTLSSELKQAIVEDKLYWLRNDAKIKASTTSKSYDEFRDIVAAAHLNSLDRKEITKKHDISWNKYATEKLE